MNPHLAHQIAPWIAAGIFTATYAGLAIGKLPGSRADRAAKAMSSQIIGPGLYPGGFKTHGDPGRATPPRYASIFSLALAFGFTSIGLMARRCHAMTIENTKGTPNEPQRAAIRRLDLTL